MTHNSVRETVRLCYSTTSLYSGWSITIILLLSPERLYSSLAAYFILENNLPLRAALETKRMIQTDIRMISNDNFGTNYLHFNSRVSLWSSFRENDVSLYVRVCLQLSVLCVCLFSVCSFIHLSLSFSPLLSRRAASEAHLSPWLLWVLPLWPSPYCVSRSHLDYISIFFIYTYCSTVSCKGHIQWGQTESEALHSSKAAACQTRFTAALMHEKSKGC